MPVVSYSLVFQSVGKKLYIPNPPNRKGMFKERIQKIVGAVGWIYYLSKISFRSFVCNKEISPTVEAMESDNKMEEQGLGLIDVSSIETSKQLSLSTGPSSANGVLCTSFVDAKKPPVNPTSRVNPNHRILIQGQSQTEEQMQMNLDATFGKDGFNPNLIPINLKPWSEWTLNDFEVGKSLSGRFDIMFLARTKQEKRIVALKIMEVEYIEDNGLEGFINRETEIHTSLRHPNIIRMFGYFLDGGRVAYVLEYVPGGSVFDDLKNQPLRRYNEERVATWMDQLVSAVQYLQTKRIIHRDIRPENLLIGYFGEIKLRDFKRAVVNCEGYKDRKYRRTVCGRYDYKPPEMLENKPYDGRVDVWSIGVLIYELLAGFHKTPLRNARAIKSFDRLGELVIHELPEHLPIGAGILITGILRRNPDARLLLSEIKGHHWILTNKKVPAHKVLLPCFQKYEVFKPILSKKYGEAGRRLQARRDAEREKEWHVNTPTCLSPDMYATPN